MRDKLFVILFLCFATISFSQENQFTNEEVKINKFVSGSLLVPPSEENIPLVIFIQGSGLTDRNGNNPQMQNNSLKMLAQGLAKNNIASFRYDKRMSKFEELGISGEKFRFDDFITDAISVLDYFENQGKYRKIIMLGHSQGSLVGMLAAKNKADAFISIAGPAQPIDSILIGQIAGQMPTLEENIRNSFKEMREIDSTTNYHPFLASIFRPSAQAFLLSWMQYNPTEEITKLNIPVLLINGNRDLQISQEEAQSLKEAKPEAKLVLLDKMNHVLKKIEDPTANLASYNNPDKPLHSEIISAITSFIKTIVTKSD